MRRTNPAQPDDRSSGESVPRGPGGSFSTKRLVVTRVATKLGGRVGPVWVRAAGLRPVGRFPGAGTGQGESGVAEIYERGGELEGPSPRSPQLRGRSTLDRVGTA